MNKEYALYPRQICFFFLAFLPVIKFFSMPSYIASLSRNDGWISALLISLLDFLTLYFILTLSKKTDKTLKQIISELFGKKVSYALFIFYAVYFFAKSIIPVIEQKTYIEQTLYEVAPSPLYFLPFFFLAFYLCTKNLRIIGRVSDIAFFFSAAGTVILFVMSIKNADIDAIFPIAKRRADIFSGSYNLSVWFNDCVYMLFFLGNFKPDEKGVKKIMISYILAEVIVIVFCLLFYCIFTYIADRQVIALSQLSEYNSVINHSGRFDNIGIIIILFSSVFSLSFPIYFCVLSLTEVFGKKNKTAIIFTVFVAEIIIHYFLYAHLKTVKNIIFSAFCPYFFALGNILPIIIAIAYFIKGKKYEVKVN